jgi:hypothetical protein
MTGAQRMARITSYVVQKGECTLGEIELELHIPISTQYELYRAFKEHYPMVELVRSRWRYKELKELVPAPQTRQDILSAQKTTHNVGM